VLGLETLLLGFDWEQPLTEPKAVSSTAELKAAPQFGSLGGFLSFHFSVNRHSSIDLVPATSTRTIEVRANVM
jgi:hypothetical protein